MVRNSKTKGEIVIGAISKVINLINLGWWKQAVEPKPHLDASANISDLREVLLEAAKAIAEYESQNAGKYIKTSIWHDPNKSGRIIQNICDQHNFNLPEEAVMWVLENYESRPFTWEFNHCHRPKFWYGERVALGIRQGVITNLDYRDEICQGNNKKGWWYKIRWDGKLSQQGVHEDSLASIPRNDQLFSTKGEA